MNAVQRKRRRIAIFINDMHAAGGIQRVAANLASALGAEHETLILTVEPLADPVFQSPELTFRSLDLARAAFSRLSYVSELVSAGRRLRAFVKAERIDAVIAIWYDWSCVAALALPRSVTTIGCEHISFFEPPRFWRILRRLSYPRLDAVIGLTQEDLPRLQRIARFADVIPNAVTIPELASAVPRERILLTVGHLIARKGIDRLLWALQAPLQAHPEWKLVIVGGGEKGHVDWGFMDYVALLVRLLRLENQVELYPATPRIADWYQRAAIYVMGSRQEGLPLVLIEAKAHGLPIVSFDCPTGPKEIVRHAIDGFLVPGDSHAFGAAAERLMTDQPLWQAMSAAAIEDARARFSTAAVSQRWLALIDRLHQARDA